MSYTPHPFANLFPLLPEDELAALAADIKSNGLLQPITLFQDMILDGRNRHAACLLAGVEPQFEPFTGNNSEARGFVVSQNIMRRHLSPFTRGELALKLKPVIAERAKDRMRCGANQHSPSPMLDKGKPIDTMQEIADAAGIGRSTLAKIETITAADIAPETEAKLRAGDTTINKVYHQVKADEKRAAIAERIAAVAAAKIKNGSVDIHSTDRKYSIIYADPPWRGYESDQNDPSLHYPTMTIDEIAALPVANVAEPIAYLTTNWESTLYRHLAALLLAYALVRRLYEAT